MWLFYCIYFAMNYDILKSKSLCFKTININKTRQPKMENPTHSVLERWTLCFSSCKNLKLKVKLWWVSAHERNKSAFFVKTILPEENFFNICVLSQCIVYWTNFENIYSFTYQKTLLHMLQFTEHNVLV